MKNKFQLFFLTPLIFFLSALSLAISADIDVQAEFDKAIKKKGGSFMDSDCDAAIYTEVDTGIILTFLQTYERELTALKFHSACQNTAMANQFKIPANVIQEYLAYVLVNFNDYIPDEDAMCPSGISDKRVKELFFEPYALRATLNHYYSFLFTFVINQIIAGTEFIEFGFDAEQVLENCQKLISNPRYNMPPSWLD